MLIAKERIEVAVAPFVEGDELVIDLQIGGQDITPVRVQLSQLFEEYIEYNSEMFGKNIAIPHREDTKQLIGILRLAAHTLEQALT